MKSFIKTKICIIAIFCLIVGISIFYAQIAAVQASKFNGITIVLDAGHGGPDVQLGQFE